ncbi:MAG: site-specific DNA-methyltransferase [Bacteroidetes bacterium]|nr:MAG: site-specific DNA-methyltransferase [Bacteroidota bacterium]
MPKKRKSKPALKIGEPVAVYSSKHKSLPKNTIICGDALNTLQTFPDDSINLIVTSPPYADRREKTYGGIAPEKYVEWFLPITNELKRVLRLDGSFVLNIKEKAENGERHTYVLELILEMRKQGWLWTEEYVWHKRNSYPGKWPNRFRDAWERCIHFTKNKKFAMYQESVMVPVGNWAQKRLSKLSDTDKRRDESKTKSGFGKNISNWLNREMVYPTNVLHLATESSNTKHSAAYPISLPIWFIRLFTKEGDIVLDPFIGSGTTAIACKELQRDYIGIDILKEYCELAEARLKKKYQPTLLDIKNESEYQD